MSGRSSKTKGAGGEREVAKILAAAGLIEAARMPLSGAIPDFPGDVRLDGYSVEVKRTERFQVWAALKQAYAAASGGRIPVVIFRRNQGEWHVIESLESWAEKECELREFRRLFAPNGPPLKRAEAQMNWLEKRLPALLDAQGVPLDAEKGKP